MVLRIIESLYHEAQRDGLIPTWYIIKMVYCQIYTVDKLTESSPHSERKTGSKREVCLSLWWPQQLAQHERLSSLEWRWLCLHFSNSVRWYVRSCFITAKIKLYRTIFAFHSDKEPMCSFKVNKIVLVCNITILSLSIELCWICTVLGPWLSRDGKGSQSYMMTVTYMSLC